MASQQPAISVCIPTYNRVAYLAECVRAVVQQDRTDWELVIADNASNDGTQAWAATLNDPRIRYERHNVNVGSCHNWNRCVELARGEYIAICHDDDRYEPTFLRRTCDVLDRHPTAGFVYTAAYLTDGQGRRTGRSRPHATDQFWNRPALCQRFLKCNHDVVFSSVVARRTAYERAGRFDPELLCGDFEMWLKLACCFDVGYLADPLVSYRSHGLSTTASMSPVRFVEENRIIVNRFIDWASPQMPSLREQRAAALTAVERVWSWRLLQTSWKCLAEGALEQAGVCLGEAQALRGACWVHGLCVLTQGCLNTIGRRAARFVQRLRGWYRWQRMMSSGMSTS